MPPVRHVTLLSVLLASCAGAPVAPQSPGVTLRFQPREGAQFRAHFVLTTTLPQGAGRVRTTSDVDLTVVGAEPDFTTLRARVAREQVDLPDNPVRLPAAAAESHGDLELRVDDRGRPVGAPLVLAAAATPAVGGYLWGPPVLPPRGARVGALWPPPLAFSWLGENVASEMHDSAFRLDAIEGDRAHVSWTLRSSLAPVDNAGTPIPGELQVDGDTWLGLGDGVPRRGSQHATVRWPDAQGDMARLLPSRVDVSWCLAAEGEPPCATEAAQTDSRPVARAYEGDACTARVAALRTSFEALSTEHYEVAPPEPLAVVEGGTEPITATQPRVVVARDGALTLDGRPMASAAEIAASMEAARRSYPDEHFGEAFPGRVRIVAGADVPLSPVVVTLLHTLGRTLTVELLVDTGRHREVPSAPRWVDDTVVSTELQARSAELAQALGTASAGCAPLAAALRVPAGGDSAAHDSALRADVPRYVAGCRCGGVDVDALGALLAGPGAAADEGLALVVLQSGQGGAAVHLPRTGTMRELARTVAAHAGPIQATRIRLR